MNNQFKKESASRLWDLVGNILRSAFLGEAPQQRGTVAYPQDTY